MIPTGSLLVPCLLLGGLAWFFLFLGELFSRLMEILKTLGRLFFIGPQRMLSVIVIAIAARPLAARPLHHLPLRRARAAIRTVALYVFFAYAVAWFYGFWCEILLARRFIRLLSDEDGRADPRSTTTSLGDEAVSRVRNGGRTDRAARRGAAEGQRASTRTRLRSGIERTRRADGRALTFLTPVQRCCAEFRTQLEDQRLARPGSDPLPRVRDLQRASSPSRR